MDFISTDCKKALRGVSRASSYDPRTMQERLLAMTRRANTEQKRLHELQNPHEYKNQSEIVGTESSDSEGGNMDHLDNEGVQQNDAYWQEYYR